MGGRKETHARLVATVSSDRHTSRRRCLQNLCRNYVSRRPTLVAHPCSRRTWDIFVAGVVLSVAPRTGRLGQYRSVGKRPPQKASSGHVTEKFFVVFDGFLLERASTGGRKERRAENREKGGVGMERQINKFACSLRGAPCPAPLHHQRQPRQQTTTTQSRVRIGDITFARGRNQECAFTSHLCLTWGITFTPGPEAAACVHGKSSPVAGCSLSTAFFSTSSSESRRHLSLLTSYLFDMGCHSRFEMKGAQKRGIIEWRGAFSRYPREFSNESDSIPTLLFARGAPEDHFRRAKDNCTSFYLALQKQSSSQPPKV